ncbi:MAG: helix-turn-helix transcriptional regulator [Noviherbaspirillum sp.]
MRRADRLFQIAQYLRGRRLTTAKQLADWLSVSERTIYRDIRDLSLSGVPVEGEAGVGYRIKAGYDLQPLMFSPDEIDALVIGMRMVQAWGGPQLAASGAAALAKITLALPKDKRAFVEATALFAPSFHIDPLHGERLEQIRQAISQRCKLQLDYTDAGGNASQRIIWPLALYFWGGTWSIAAWCEMRADFRNFRLDRVRSLQTTDRYPDQDGRRLADFVRGMQQSRRSSRRQS